MSQLFSGKDIRLGFLIGGGGKKWGEILVGVECLLLLGV